MNIIKQKFPLIINIIKKITHKLWRFFLVTFVFIFLPIYIVFYLITIDLRLKPSYSRDITINFLYKNKEYTITPTITCVNFGPTINEGSMEWYTSWGGGIKNDRITLNDGVTAEISITTFNKGFIEEIFETRIKGHEDYICGTILAEDSNVGKFDRMMKYSGSSEDNAIGTGRISLKSFVNHLESKKYTNSSHNFMHLRNIERNPKFIMGIKTDEPMFKKLDIKIKSIKFSEKQIIKSYKKYLPFFLDPKSY